MKIIFNVKEKAAFSISCVGSLEQATIFWAYVSRSCYLGPKNFSGTIGEIDLSEGIRNVMQYKLNTFTEGVDILLRGFNRPYIKKGILLLISLTKHDSSFNYSYHSKSLSINEQTSIWINVFTFKVNQFPNVKLGLLNMTPFSLRQSF